MPSLLSIHLGRTSYAKTWNLQQQVWSLRSTKNIPDTLLLTEHEHVYTLGKSGTENHLLATKDELAIDGIEVFNVDRGGDITYHGPGQLVGYPILDLEGYKKDVHWYLRMIEEVLIHALSKFGIKGEREEGLTGVWVDGEKIAAIGIKISRWVTMHGFALNVSTDLSKFRHIIPCGIFHKGVTSMEKVLNTTLPFDVVLQAVEQSFAELFACSLKVLPKEEFITLLNTREVEQ